MDFPIFSIATGAVAIKRGTWILVPRSVQVLVLFVLMISGAAAQTLTLAEAQRLAVERSRQVSAQNAAVAASREMALAAGQLPDPVLKLGIQDLPVDGPDRFSVARELLHHANLAHGKEVEIGRAHV